MDKGNKEEAEVNEIEEGKSQKRKTNVKNETRRGTITMTLERCFFSSSRLEKRYSDLYRFI